MLTREVRMVQLANFRARWYWAGTVGWILWFVSPALPGWLLSKVFDEMQRHEASSRFWVLLACFTAAEVLFAWWIAVAHRTYIPGVESSKALVRANVVGAQLASGGSQAAPRNVAVGDVLSRLRDDPFDVLFLLDNWVDLLGVAIYSVIAVWLLVRIDPWAALVGIGPLLLVGWGNSLLANVARRYRSRARVTGSAVSEYLAAAFEASLTVKVNGAQPAMLRRLDQLNAKRAKAAVGDDVWNDVMWSVNGSISDVFVGLALVVASRGRLSSGEIALFAAYLLNLMWLPNRIGGIIVGRRRYDVSVARLDALVGDTSAGASDGLVVHRDLPILGGPAVDPPSLSARQPLERLEVRGLTVASRGLSGVDLMLERGTLTVVSGPVGAGKTSLLRAIIGLQEIDAGEVRWNGSPVVDRAAFFTPPHCAYVAQVPRLFAESLADNLRLGYPIDDAVLHEAIRLAAFEPDVADLPEGLATTVGARGVRLSGGQAQRAGAARALAQRPELLVLDDLTSALDVETEIAVWDRLAAAGYTVLAASNRPTALSRADQVIPL